MNKRMTKRDTDGQAMMDCEKCKADWTGKHGKPMADCTALYCRNRLKDRLAAYEDTGLTPEEVSELKASLGIGNFCKDCALFTPQDDGYYGRCPHQKNVLVHGYEKSCGCFGRKDGVVILPKEDEQ